MSSTPGSSLSNGVVTPSNPDGSVGVMTRRRPGAAPGGALTARSGSCASAPALVLDPAATSRSELVEAVEHTLRDHVRLTEALARAIGRLRQARLLRGHVDDARTALCAFLAQDLVPTLRADDAAVSEAAERNAHDGRLASRTRTSRGRTRELDRVVHAVSAVLAARTAPQALVRAERLRALVDDYVAREDRELLAAARHDGLAGRAPVAGGISLTDVLGDVLVQDHRRIARAVEQACHPAGSFADQMHAFDRAAAALSHHAAVMATTAYPAARRALAGHGQGGVLDPLHADLHGSVCAVRELHWTFRGKAGHDPRRVGELWADLRESWRRHTTDEEDLLHSVGHHLGADQALSVIAALRRPAGRSLTRPHPGLLRGDLRSRIAVRAHYRLDHWRDQLDNRESWRVGD